MTRNKLIDFEIIGYFVGKITLGIGLIQVVPLVTALAYGEWDIFLNFVIGSSSSLICGNVLVMLCKSAKGKKLGWGHGMAVAALSWLLGMMLCAIPYYLCGNYLSFLDACFDVMSGFTTTGLVLIQDLDHVSNGVNMWRHILTYVGGQGMVVLALTFLVNGTNGAYKMYVGEAKDEQILPNVISTARVIWYISIVYLIVGSLALWINGMLIGLKPDRALLHGMWVFMAAWSTGGFAPQSQNIMYYHSLSYELLTVALFVIGSFNFALHYAVWTRKKAEIRKNIEIISMTITVIITTILVMLGLMKLNTYPDFISMCRMGIYQLISGHTTTGFMTLYAKQFYNEWGDIALLAMIIAMLIGGSACSTAGGFKGLRIGIIFKTFMQDVKRMIIPESMVQIEKFHHIRDITLEDRHTRSAMLIVILYVITFTIGTTAGVLSGYPFLSSAFESASVTGNVGLSIGITQASMPDMLKAVYIAIMWVARLEFMSVLALAAFIISEVKVKWAK
ncbi:Trk system potassium uptake protein TrkG [Oxobacter pfennigii]|uniref:Trk system potassium uptake protein TrkG n=1 Tax=Oxobacter pfennigii TaxID=36849 RepID=A0A0P8YA10_9CLOT|nr:potassium transporter TrkG [Oxobacter pfennigii]KPU43773.1 Trk system potassium uptake protein TrkG [Oxobacter pfennigii]